MICTSGNSINGGEFEQSGNYHFSFVIVRESVSGSGGGGYRILSTSSNHTGAGMDWIEGLLSANSPLVSTRAQQDFGHDGFKSQFFGFLLRGT